MGVKLDNPFAQYVNTEADPIVQPATTPRQDAADARDERSLGIREETARLTNQLTELKIRDERRQQEEEAAEAEKRQNADGAARSKLIATIGKLAQAGADANDNGGWFETGTSGAFRMGLPLAEGSPAFSLREDIKTIDGRFAFDALQAMREASKTGGALGQVTERELDLLKAATANINPDMDHETFMRNVEEARQAYLSKLAMVDPEAARDMGYDAKIAESAWMKYNDAYAEELGYSKDRPAVKREQPATEAYPDDIDAIMKKYGG